VEARGDKVLPIYAQSSARLAWSWGIEAAEMSNLYALQRNRSWFVRHDS
jgi:hypothetical protein